jgi:hypothetical protein
MLGTCLPTGQEKFLVELGVPVAIRTTPPPNWMELHKIEFKAKAPAGEGLTRTLGMGRLLTMRVRSMLQP